MSGYCNPNGLEPGSRLSWNDSSTSRGQSKGQSSQQESTRYLCPCGSSMSRSDILLRHIRKCQMARDKFERSGPASKKPSRSKTACNECAASRLKCDSQNPCSRCKKKSSQCEYTREGYSDMYKVFRVPAASPVVENATESYPHQLHNNHMNTVSATGTSPDAVGSATSIAGQSGVLDFNGLDFNAPLEYMDSPFLSGHGSTSMNDAFQDLDWDSILTFPEWPDNIAPMVNDMTNSSDSTETSSGPRDSAWNFTEGLRLQQIDSVEAKCVEIQTYIGTFHTGIDHTILSKYLTRDRLVNCVQLYAKHFQSINPILHLPTFELTKTPPDLLIAIMLVGACYTNNVIPPTIVVQGAIHMLLILECSSHERAMSAPSLASIQAIFLLCQILMLTQNPQAYYYATMHRARTISMAERAGLFCDPIYNIGLDENTFDWHLWTQSEMRKRLAHHIFVHDIGSNIFTRDTSHISPYTFYVYTPCYNNCWVAPTASECFERLRSAPPPIQVAMAVKKLRSASSIQDHYLFDASDCGMLETIIALHSILSRAMEESLVDENIVPDGDSAFPAQATYTNFSDLLNHEFLNYEIANIANKIVGEHGSVAIRRIDEALNAWLRNWNARRVHDIYDERHSAFNHPLNFWFLAKLFIVLHFLRNRYDRLVPGMGEGGQPGRDSELYVFYSSNNGAAQGKLAIQMQVIGWLSKLRKQREGSLSSGGSLLSEVLSMQ